MFNRFFAIIWRIIVFLFNLFPAMILVAAGAASILLWRPVNSLVTRLLNWVPIETHFCRALESLSQWWLPKGVDGLKSRLIRGEREEVARALWPQVEFPDLYQEVPDDVVRPPFDDGRLVGGLRLQWLGDRYMTDAAVRSAARLGVTTACLMFFVLTAWYLLTAYAASGDLLTQLKGGEVVIERWPGQPPTTVPTWWVITATASVIGSTLFQGLYGIVLFLAGAALMCTGSGLLAMLVLLRSWQKEKAAPYEWQSKDADVRWAYRAETRNLVRMTYRKQVEQATQYLRGLPCFLIGRATGTLRARGDLSAPTAGQPLQLDQESLFQHLLVFGGTGEGKTTALLKPLIRQLLRQQHYGMYVCDAKGVLWNDVYALARTERPNNTPIIIGTGADQKGVDVLAGLTPTQVAGTLRSVMTQVSGGTDGDSFWPDMAANLLRNILSVAQAYALTEEGAALITSQGMSPYSLWWAYQAVLHSEHIDAATAALRQWIDAVQQKAEKLLDSPSEYDELKRVYNHLIATKEVYDSMAYLESTWRDMAAETKSGIIASVTQLLDGFAGTEVLRDRFACGNPANTISIAEALNGQIVLNALSSVEDGLPARIVSVLIKTNLYREARSREAAFRQGNGKIKPQDQPCIVMMDEVQEIVTADVTSGLSDATFWNVARSTGVAGIFATQTVASLYQAIGKDAANNFMQQARSKVFFRTEDQDTVEYACWCAGKYERNRVYDDGHRESLEYRRLIDGWNPLSPVDEAQTVQGGATVFFSSAIALLFPERFTLGAAQARPAYFQDNRFIPVSMSGESGIAARAQAFQAAAWRAEDLERDYRKTGNELVDALMLADLIHMGRWHAFAQIQRAGAVRQDIIMVEHDFT
jgi:hypothetical protein